MGIVKFLKSLFNSYNKSENQERKALTMFQIGCNNINNHTIDFNG